MTSEPYLVRIGENVTISGNVTFVTHDNSISKISPQYVNLFGYISIGDNCFLGQNSTIMYGCTLANNIIVARNRLKWIRKQIERSQVLKVVMETQYITG